MAFSAPVVNEGVKVADFNGHLLIVTPVEYKTGINTVNGIAEAIEVNVVDLDTLGSYRVDRFEAVVLGKRRKRTQEYNKKEAKS
jgi:hypothetical protein